MQWNPWRCERMAASCEKRLLAAILVIAAHQHDVLSFARSGLAGKESQAIALRHLRRQMQKRRTRAERASSPARPPSKRVGSFGFCAIAVQEFIEPVALPVQAFDQMFRLARSRQVVILPREDHQFGIHAVMLQQARNHCSPCSSGTR